MQLASLTLIRQISYIEETSVSKLDADGYVCLRTALAGLVPGREALFQSLHLTLSTLASSCVSVQEHT